MKPEIVVITGPTASGKSKYAIEAARECNGEIISADSVCVYRDFNIGSNKPTPEELEQVPHHLLSFLHPAQDFSAGEYIRYADKKISEIHKRGALPMVVGGTGLYIRALLCGLVPTDISTPDTSFVEMESKLRTNAHSDIEFREMMHAWLQKEDSLAASRISQNDLQRIRRALLVKLNCGKTLSALQVEHSNLELRFHALIVALFPSREALYAEINTRVEYMLASGLVDEVSSLRKLYGKNCKAMQSIGYRHVSEYLDGHLDINSMIETMKRDTRRYAKRQLTWWRNQSRTLGWNELGHNGDSESPEIIPSIIKKFLKRGRPHAENEIFFRRIEGYRLSSGNESEERGA